MSPIRPLLLRSRKRLSQGRSLRTNRPPAGAPRKRRRQPLCVERLEDRTVPAGVPPPSGLVSWWAADGDATDLVGPNHGSLHNGVGFLQGYVGEGFDFDGADDNVQAPTTGLPTSSPAAATV
jgi:hypothetical protein